MYLPRSIVSCKEVSQLGFLTSKLPSLPNSSSSKAKDNPSFVNFQPFLGKSLMMEMCLFWKLWHISLYGLERTQTDSKDFKLPRYLFCLQYFLKLNTYSLIPYFLYHLIYYFTCSLQIS